MAPWCFDVDAKIERASIVSSFTLKHAALCGDVASQGGTFGNHKMSPGATSGEMKFKFGDGGKTTHEVKVREVKAIFGKFVKEGKLTIESRDGVKMLIKGPPAECARLMKTLTTLKSQPANARDAYLKGLEPCARCKDKCQANMQKAEEKQRKIVEAQIAAHEMTAEKKRKREAEELEKRASKDAAKASEELRALEEKKNQVERMKAEIAQLKIDIVGERESLLQEKESLVQSRRELEDEKRLLEREKGLVQEERDSMEQQLQTLRTERLKNEEEGARLASQKSALASKRASLEEDAKKLANETAEFESKREEFVQSKAQFDRERAREGTTDDASARGVREEAARRARMREEARAEAVKNGFKEASPGSFYGKKKAKIVMDDDESDNDDANTNDKENAKPTVEDLKRQTLNRVEMLRKAEMERQLREKLARDELARKQHAAEQQKNQTKKAAMEAKAARERRAQQEAEFRDHARRQSEQAARMQKKTRATSVPTATKAMWDSHLSALERMKSSPEGSLGEADIPWPPEHNIAFFSHADGPNDRKKKVTKATLSWHPDKFEAKYGKLLKPSAAAKIKERVRELSSQYIELRQVLASS